MKKYMTPDFDVTVYEIKENIANMDGDTITSIDIDGDGNGDWMGDLTPEV